jgi:nicotinamide-nucleotide amidase
MTDQIWAEVITVGSELVLGQLVDTNAAYIAQALSEIGVGLAYHTTVGDDRRRMLEAFRQAVDRCQIVVTTGGIGPTEDDLTREAAAEVFGRRLELRPELVTLIQGFFDRLGYKMADNNRKQAYIPQGAEVIQNPRGTAPAFRIEQDGRVMICLPGVPAETEPLIREEVLPFLRERYSPGGRVWLNRVLKICGVGESNVDDQLKDLIRDSDNPTIGLQASPGEVKVRLTARADSKAEAKRLLDDKEAEVRAVMGPMIYGVGDETLSGNAAGLLEEKNLTLAVAETLSQGRITAEMGGRLRLGRLKGALVLSRPDPAETLARRIMDEFRPDLALAVSGRPDDDGRMEIDIKVLSADGGEKSRRLVIGGPNRIVVSRATTIGTFTLFQYLRDEA